MAVYSGIYPFKMVIFHSYVELPKGIYQSYLISHIPPKIPWTLDAWDTSFAAWIWHVLRFVGRSQQQGGITTGTTGFVGSTPLIHDI